MERIRKRFFSWTFFFLFFLCNVFGHQRISKLYEGIVVSYGREKVEKFLIVVAIAGFLIFTGWIALVSFRRYKNLLQPFKILSLWFIAIFLCYGAYGLLICSKVEIVHFPQYAILAFWGMFLIEDTAKTVSMVTFLGIFDETVNYILYPRFTPYLDLNDMVLNFCGALVGTVFYHAVTGKIPLTKDNWAFRLGYVIVFFVVAIIIAGIVTGKVVLENTFAVPTTPIQNGQFILSFQHYEPFWHYTSAGIRYHIMTPVEGILLVGVLLSAVHAICNFSVFKRHGYNQSFLSSCNSTWDNESVSSQSRKKIGSLNKSQDTAINKVRISNISKSLRFRWIQIEISSLCQASCLYCPHTVYKKFWQGRFIPENLFSKLVEFFHFSELVFLQGWGEPLLHPRFFDFVRVAKQRGSMVGTTTNGMLINKDVAKRLVDVGLDIISFSLAGSSYRNDLIRRGTSIDHVLRAMEWVREERESRGLLSPRIHVSYLLLKSMLPELEKLPSVVANAGAEKIVISTLSLVPDPTLKNEIFFTSEEKWQEENKELDILARRYIFKESHKWLAKLEVDIETKQGSFGKGQKKFLQCPEQPVNSFFIGSYGKVSPCVFLGLPVKPTPPGIFSFDFGYLSRASVEKIWLRPSYQAFRENFLRGELPFPCFKCSRRGTTYQRIS